MNFPKEPWVSNILGNVPGITSFSDIFQVLCGEFKLGKLLKLYPFVTEGKTATLLGANSSWRLNIHFPLCEDFFSLWFCFYIYKTLNIWIPKSGPVKDNGWMWGVFLSILKFQRPSLSWLRRESFGNVYTASQSVSACNLCGIRKAYSSPYQPGVSDQQTFIERFNDLDYFMEGGKYLPENPLTCQ